ncbi:MAG TPA: hypothetical protein VHS78_15190, partial [Candidatus Elarobacter sp.]|jgi:CheY-like chemotaxis protein|nr:hypothetical protein [Candidatus Elarobacter sp.]
VRAAPRAPDFIVADYHLGTGESGLDAIRAIRAACGGTPAAIVVTGDRSDEVRRAVGGAGAHLLHKPLRTAQLRSLLAHLAVS